MENSGLSKTSKWKSIVHRMMKHAAFRKFLFLYYTYNKKKNLDKYETKIANSDLLIIGGNMIFDLDSHTSSSSQFNQFV